MGNKTGQAQVVRKEDRRWPMHIHIHDIYYVIIQWLLGIYMRVSIPELFAVVDVDDGVDDISGPT